MVQEHTVLDRKLKLKSLQFTCQIHTAELSTYMQQSQIKQHSYLKVLICLDLSSNCCVANTTNTLVRIHSHSKYPPFFTGYNFDFRHWCVIFIECLILHVHLQCVRNNASWQGRTYFHFPNPS